MGKPAVCLLEISVLVAILFDEIHLYVTFVLSLVLVALLWSAADKEIVLVALLWGAGDKEIVLVALLWGAGDKEFVLLALL
jgi:hypothetical protein